MTRRLPTGGRLIDRKRPVGFRFNGRQMRGMAGDTLASALLANGQLLQGRSFKYHRPRGPVASGAEEPNALMAVGLGRRMEPNQRATLQELHEGLSARSQNHWPSLDWDFGAVAAALGRALPAGFYYKMFKWPQAFWKHVYEPAIRRSAGLGPAPAARDADRYEHFNVTVDVLVIGGGIAGLQAARSAATDGARVLVFEQSPHWGGRSPVDGTEIGPETGTETGAEPAEVWIHRTVEELRAMPNVRLRARTLGAGIYDHGWALGYERLGDHEAESEGPRHRLWKVRARRIVVAAGAIERPLAFAGNDLPGVMLASAVRDYVVNWAVSPGDRTVLVTNNDDAYRTALALHRVGLLVSAVLDARPTARGALADAVRQLGIRVDTGAAVLKVLGRRRVEAVLARRPGGIEPERIDCEVVAMSGGWSPVVHLWSHCGGKLIWDEAAVMFRPDPDRPPTGADGTGMVIAAGSANGHLLTSDVLADATRAGLEAAGALAKAEAVEVPEAVSPAEEPMLPVWVMPQDAGPDLREKMFLDFQNDVKVSDIALAAQEGYESVEHAKRYTTLGMGTDQGKLANINGMAVLADARGAPIHSVGTTTFRPPYTPISMGAIAGEARGGLFQPIRRTPLHDRHEALGAVWEPVGQWRRAFVYPRPGESTREAVAREVLAVREAAGMLDASTLGKLLVKGPDAGRFLDMIYTGAMPTLPVGRCRYGLICSENGFLIDDGVVARLSGDTWLCHTTTGGADRIHAHMEEWLQTEWWDWKVHILNVTEQYAQIAVAGPEARNVLEVMADGDISAEALPFMHWTEGRLAGIPARMFRISFSGELSFEIAVRAGDGPALWDALARAGAPFGIGPYGTEAMHVLRAEKGFLMIGDETDGTVIPQDLGLGWAISKKKADFIGKRAQAREHMTDPGRWRLVGLETLDGSVLPEGALALADGINANGQRTTQGRVTSSYQSPTLGRGIAMGLVLRGPERMGEVLSFSNLDGPPIGARIVSAVFYDPEGSRQDV